MEVYTVSDLMNEVTNCIENEDIDGLHELVYITNNWLQRDFEREAQQRLIYAVISLLEDKIYYSEMD